MYLRPKNHPDKKSPVSRKSQLLPHMKFVEDSLHCLCRHKGGKGKSAGGNIDCMSFPPKGDLK